MIVDAMSLPEARGAPWKVVFTGEMSDYRGREHIDRLLSDVRRNDLNTNADSSATSPNPTR